jgi:hypothetical protein
MKEVKEFMEVRLLFIPDKKPEWEFLQDGVRLYTIPLDNSPIEEIRGRGRPFYWVQEVKIKDLLASIYYSEDKEGIKPYLNENSHIPTLLEYPNGEKAFIGYYFHNLFNNEQYFNLIFQRSR